MSKESYEQAQASADAMLKLYMQLEYMTSQLSLVEIIMDSIYRPAGEQKPEYPMTLISKKYISNKVV